MSKHQKVTASPTISARCFFFAGCLPCGSGIMGSFGWKNTFSTVAGWCSGRWFWLGDLFCLQFVGWTLNIYSVKKTFICTEKSKKLVRETDSRLGFSVFISMISSWHKNRPTKNIINPREFARNRHLHAETRDVRNRNGGTSCVFWRVADARELQLLAPDSSSVPLPRHLLGVNDQPEPMEVEVLETATNSGA